MYCNTNRKRTAIQIGGVLRMTFSRSRGGGVSDKSSVQWG